MGKGGGLAGMQPILPTQDYRVNRSVFGKHSPYSTPVGDVMGNRRRHDAEYHQVISGPDIFANTEPR
jgi:hypothetical protein